MYIKAKSLEKTMALWAVLPLQVLKIHITNQKLAVTF